MAYTIEEIDKVFNEIIQEIEDGKALRTILKHSGMPSSSTFYIWIEEDKKKSKRYAHACDVRTEIKFESIERDYLETPQRDKATGKIDAGWVQLQRLKIDSKKWELSKLKPKKYGDKIETTIEGGDKPVNIVSLGGGVKPK